ncbi:penicillin-binding protein 1C [Sphaerotilus microaerophilus]|uniref:peptidoglycan glycosyltransferase n=1 Tax=Sphaerotilus microaerophilus TaxID=2914710 RepID=A0ABN6PG51_9BURK|nr:penicillin-binding protein 1C [Sphaerotilus sp. FB-5]BDI03652.1 penicillin-binding protein [Sphaerotilus sp. FB-5]
MRLGFRLLGVGLASVTLAGSAWALPGLAEVRAAHQPSELTFVDRHGEPLQSLRVDARSRRLPWVALDDISPALRVSVVLSEDRRFLEHGGVDWSGLARSAWANLRTLGHAGKVQGASTLTMQLAGLIDGEHARPAGGRSLLGKVGQIAAARQIDARWRKRDILEAYLNLVPLRGELVGVPAAARILLGKHPSGLDAQEAALLAALLRAPNAGREAVTRRACELLTLQQLPCAGLEGLAGRALATGAGARAGQPADLAWAPHYARAAWQAADVARRATPGPLRTPLDAGLQRLAVQLLRQQLAELNARHVEDGAVLVLDNASGEVRAWVGSSGAALSDAAQVDAVQARRQPGSTLKPFVYALAFERRLITPASLLDDTPTRLMAGSGLYTPQNYDRRFHGWVSARTALASSLNVPAVQLATWLTPDALFERLNAHGLALTHSGGHHGPALALGSAEVTLLALTNAYRSLANGGRFSPVRLWPAEPAGPAVTAWKPAASPAAAFLVGDILADNAARSLTFGLDSPLVTRGWAAVKTGTSKDLRDNWCIGWTDRYTVGVWVGNASGAPMQQVSGSSGAAPVWRALVQALHEGQPARPPTPPAGVVRQITVAGDAPASGGVAEYFLAGTELARLRRGAHARVAGSTALQGIASPRDGAIYALDPDIPPAVQRIVFEGEAGSWWLDGRRLGQGARVAWPPWPGRHRLELRLAGGRRQQVGFEVRGAQARAPAPGSPPTAPAAPNASPPPPARR